MEGQKRFYIPALDGIRAASIAVVFVAHAGLGDVVPGGFGVTVFFFLSGFLISTLLRREFARSGTVNFRNFYIRRALRILPPFYGALVLACVLAVFDVTPGGLDLRGVALLALHFGNYAQILWEDIHMPAGTGVYWSLAVEEHYYLTFPFLALALLKLGRRRVTLVTLSLLAMGILVWRIYLVDNGAPMPRTYLASDTRLDSILWGCLLALTYNPVLDPPPKTSRLAEYSALAAGTGLLLFCFVYRGDAFRETYRYTLQGVALLPIFYLAVHRAHWPIFRWLDSRPVRYIGTLSYTLYLVHNTVLYSIEHLVPDMHLVVRGVLAAMLSVALAALSYRYMERPLVGLRKQYS